MDTRLCSSCQSAWEKHREEMRAQEGNASADDWSSFWKAYQVSLSVNIDEIHQRMTGGWIGGLEEGVAAGLAFRQVVGEWVRFGGLFLALQL
jgi:hypothetical protein